MKSKHRRRLETMRHLFQRAGALNGTNRVETKAWLRKRKEEGEELPVEDLATLTAYEDLEVVLDGSIALVEALLEGRLVEFLDGLQEDEKLELEVEEAVEV